MNATTLESNLDNDKEPYTPTDDEAEAIDRAGLEAAWLELQPLKDDDQPTPKMVLACLRAFKAVSAAERGAKKALKTAHPEASYINHFTDKTYVVCSAVMGLDLNGPDEIHPNSVAGARLSALLQAAIALEAMSTVYAALDGDDSIFGDHLADETTMLSEASIRCGSEGA